MSFSKKKHVVLDLEALAGMDSSSAVITAISAVVIDGWSGESYEQILGRTQFWKLSVEAQDERESQPETVKWWEGQKEDVKVQCFYPDLNRDMKPRDVLIALNRYLISMGVGEHAMVWTRGTAYDIPKLLNLYAEYGLAPAFNSWNIADTKTAFLVRSGGKTNQFGLGRNPHGFQKHNALHDTALEAFKLASYFRELEMKTPYQPASAKATGRKGSGADRGKVEPKGKSEAGEYLQGDLFELFSGFVVGVIFKAKKENLKTYTKTISDCWKNEMPETPLKSLVVRNTLYRMQECGTIRTVKDGLYSHWEVVDGV